MDDIHKNIEEHNPNKKRKILIAFYDMIDDMLGNKKPNPIVTELFIRVRKLNISIILIIQSQFTVPKDIRLSSTHYFLMKIQEKKQLQQYAFNHSSDIEFQDLLNLYKMCTAKPFFVLVIDTTLASDNSLRFRKNLAKRILKLIMTIDDKIKAKHLQYDINREAAKKSAS